MENVVAIIGYNNTRIYDVGKVKEILNSDFDIKLLLCHDVIDEEAILFSDYQIKISYNEGSLDGNIKYIHEWEKAENKKIVGILPFSDKGVILGAALSEEKQLPGDRFDRSFICLDKSKFRNQEKKYNSPVWYKKPLFDILFSENDLNVKIKDITFPVFIKPTSEGNSRGCFVLNNKRDLEKVLPLLSSFWEQGIMIEEYLDSCAEYSFDQVGRFMWITEKETTKGSTRAEIMQIVPANISSDLSAKIIDAGQIVGEISGHISGAMHNEIFHLKNDDMASVEPNRRPAGMKVWDLANMAFENFDPYRVWINSALGKKQSEQKLKREYYVGIRNIQPNKKGKIINISHNPIKAFLEHENIVEINIDKKEGDFVDTVVKDNASFLGHVIIRNKDYNMLKLDLERIEKLIHTHIIIC